MRISRIFVITAALSLSGWGEVLLPLGATASAQTALPGAAVTERAGTPSARESDDTAPIRLAQNGEAGESKDGDGDLVASTEEVETMPSARLTLEIAEGGIAIRGIAPEPLSAKFIADILPAADRSDLSFAAQGESGVWEKAIAAFALVLSRIEAGRAVATEGEVRFTGLLRPGFAAPETAAAFRTALGPEWQAEIALTEPPDPARIEVTQDDAGRRVTGILPQGLALEEAEALLGASVAGPLVSNGAGDPEAWRTRLAGASTLMEAYGDASLRLDDDRLFIDGDLAPGQSLSDLAFWALDLVGPGLVAEIDGTETPVEEGAERVNLATGETERLTAGFWLPVYDFEPGLDRCTTEIGKILARDKIGFVSGSARVAPGGRGILNRLAAVSLICLGNSAMVLQVAGFTDDVGDDAANLKLSTARAMAVQRALVERGVSAEAIHAAGFGEADPVAANDTEEGRAANRRIEFTFALAS